VDNPHHHPAPPYPVAPYAFEAEKKTVFNNKPFSKALVAIQRVPYSVKYVPCEELEMPPPPPEAVLTVAATTEPVPHPIDPAVVDNSIPNPFDPSIDKYWAQRRRLFTKFDRGVQLDAEGWYSVTPEIIADHVAHRVGDLALAAQSPLVILDAFCGCGGNGIAFGKLPPDQISMVVCVDTDRNKLRMAAHNASLYEVPPNRIVFVECNSIFIMKHCYRHGVFILDQPDLLIEAGMAPVQLPSPVPTEVYEGYHIGGINMLPRCIDAVFMDPPWGGTSGVIANNIFSFYDIFIRENH
jgi:trimethylguanosine synthase